MSLRRRLVIAMPLMGPEHRICGVSSGYSAPF